MNKNDSIPFVMETLFVGIYCSIIYFCVCQIFNSSREYHHITVILFLVGFLKHYLGYKLHIQDYYCNYGRNAECVKKRELYSDKKLKSSDKYLLEVSVAEGGWFSIFGSLLIRKTNLESTNIMLVFFIGAVTHIFAELSGIHSQFCKKNCK